MCTAPQLEKLVFRSRLEAGGGGECPLLHTSWSGPFPPHPRPHSGRPVTVALSSRDSVQPAARGAPTTPCCTTSESQPGGDGRARSVPGVMAGGKRKGKEFHRP